MVKPPRTPGRRTYQGNNERSRDPGEQSTCNRIDERHVAPAFAQIMGFIAERPAICQPVMTTGERAQEPQDTQQWVSRRLLHSWRTSAERRLMR